MFWTCVISLVVLVTKDPVENWSVCSNDRDMILRKVSLRRSLPKFCAHRLEKTPQSTPQLPPITTHKIIFRPVVMTIFKSPTPPFDNPSTPSSTMVAIKSGCIRSIATSPIMNNGARHANKRYFFKYFHMAAPFLHMVSFSSQRPGPAAYPRHPSAVRVCKSRNPPPSRSAACLKGTSAPPAHQP